MIPARVTQFLRSLLPADIFQLCFLAGLVCFTVAPHLRWWPLGPGQTTGALQADYHGVIVVATFGFVLATSAGYYLCFWQVKRAFRSVCLLVLLPAIVALGLTAAKFLSIRTGTFSVLTQVYSARVDFLWAVRELWDAGAGFHFALIGIVLTGVFSLRLFCGLSCLPLSLSAPAGINDAFQQDWKGCKRLIWLSTASCSTVAMGVVAVAMLAPFMRRGWTGLTWIDVLQYFVGAAVLLVLSMWMAGGENRKLVYRQLRIPRMRFGLVGVVLPVIVTLTPQLVLYLLDRIQWATHDFGKFGPPRLMEYLPEPGLWTIGLLFAAFAEEVIFRGVLRRHFVTRYGVTRGIFLVGIVWAAFHFFSDRFAKSSDALVALGLFQRVAVCVILGFALSWLTLHSGSLVPATIAHWLSNVGVYSTRRGSYPGEIWVLGLLWLILTCALFRFWPVERAENEEGGAASPNQKVADTP